MHFGKEVVPADSLGSVPTAHKVNERELKVAEQLIDSLATPFDPSKYHDEYKVCVQKMIEKKAQGERIVSQPRVEKKAARAGDLMAALEASLAEARGAAKGASRSESRSLGRVIIFM